jgi:hypothetical protein
MVRIPILVTLLVLAGGDPYADRPRHPLAKSLPLLTEKENAKLEAVVNRFIDLEVGKLPKSEEKKAKDDLYRLGPEAVFVLVEGYNRAAQIDSSCATVTIGAKIERIIRSTDDIDLVLYVRENLGAGVEPGKGPLPVRNSLRSAQTVCLLRKSELLRKGVTVRPRPESRDVGSMSMSELSKAAARERGDALKKVLTEVERRQDSATPAILAKAISGTDAEGRKLAKVLLIKHAEKQSPTALKLLVKHENAEVRAAAARTIGSKGLRYGDELIGLLQDSDASVREAAHAALVQIAGGTDYGPAPGASVGDRAAATQKWRQWWQSQ